MPPSTRPGLTRPMPFPSTAQIAQSRVQGHRDRTTLLAVCFSVLSLTMASAQASSFSHPAPYETKTLGYSCESVRSAVQAISRPKLEALAQSYGITPEQRREANKCLARRR
jgi:hypothetical protein